MKSKYLITAILAIFALGFSSEAQVFSPDSLQRRFAVFSSLCSPEKVYLHIDRTYFLSTETIWFKGYLQDATERSMVPGSNFIYVELLDKEGSEVCRVKIKRDKDGFPGRLVLPETLKTGEYTLRAYTIWQLNGDPEYLFNQKIEILGDKPAAKKVWKEADPSLIDITFYPEGGRYFAGQKASIGFKAMDNLGRSTNIQGSIVDGQGATTVGFTYSAHDGMGRINFIPTPGEKYYLKLSSGKQFELPVPSTEGVTLNVRKYKGKTYATVSGVTPGKYYLLERNRKMFTTLSEIDFDGHAKAFELESEILAPGINHIILADTKGSIVSERLLFQFDKTEVKCNMTAYEKAPRPHGLINTSLSVTDQDGKALDGECSISIVRGSFKNHRQDDGLLSYMLLSSELKGHINNPNYYFDQNIPKLERENSMDLLMMIQGWHLYEFEKLVNNSSIKIKHLREYVQSIRGKISRARADKLPKNFIFSVMIPKLKFIHYASVKEASSFSIDSLNFEEGTDFLISITKRGFGRDYIPRWSGEVFAPNYKYFPAPGTSNRTLEEDKIPLVSDVVPIDTLQAAVVSAEVDEPFGSNFGGKTFGTADLKAYSHLTVVQYITMMSPVLEYNGDIMYNRRMHSNIGGSSDMSDDENSSSSNDMSDSFQDESGLVKLVIKDMEEPWWPYENIYLDQVEAISVSTMGDPVYNSPGGLVMLKLKDGAKIANAQAKESLLYFVPLGYQKPSAFYSPRYDLGDKRDGFDHRNTIFWSPSTRIYEGRAHIQFCNTDQMDYPYYVNVEGITAGGTLFSGRSVLNFEESY